MSQLQVLIFSSLPLVGIFIMGIFSCILFLRVDDEIEARKKEGREEQKRREMER